MSNRLDPDQARHSFTRSGYELLEKIISIQQKISWKEQAIITM